jgi:signal transduction histidine kinase/GAF domain-containing protein
VRASDEGGGATGGGLERFHRLRKVTSGLVSALTLDEVARVLLHAGLGLLGADGGMVGWLREPDRLEILYFRDRDEEMTRLRVPLPLDLAAPIVEATRTGRPCWVRSEQEVAARYPLLLQEWRERGYVAWGAYPLLVGGMPHGGLALAFRTPPATQPEDLALIETFVQECASALERARLHEAEHDARTRAERSAVRLAQLQAVTAGLSRALRPEDVTEVIFGEGLGSIGARSCVLFAVERDDVVVRSAFGYESGVLEETRRTPLAARRPMTDAVRERRSIWIGSIDVIVAEYGEAGRDRARRIGEQAWAAIPFVQDGRVVGGLGLGFASPQEFAEEERFFVVILAQLCEQALDRARLFEETSRRAAELDAVLETMPEGILVLGPDGRVLRSNHAADGWLPPPADPARDHVAERMAGITVADAAGRPLAHADLAVVRAIERGEEVRDQVLRVEDGSEPRFAALSAAPVRAQDGSIAGAVLALGDVTPLRRLQDEREDLLRAISHDLRTPLSVVYTHAQLLRRDPGNAAKVVDRAAAIAKCCQRMDAMIRDVVDAMRLAGAGLAFTGGPVRLDALAREVLEGLAGTLDVGRVRLEIGEEVPEVRGDPAHLERVLVNLVSNALKYSAPSSPVEVVVRTESGEVVLLVRDRGVGIAPEDLARVFERYYRVEGSRRPEGLGLGLFITRRLVEAHGGRIEVESGLGAGTTFRVVFPPLR